VPPPLPVDRLAYRRALRTSRLVTAALTLPAVWLVLEVVARHRATEPQTRASAGFAFFVLGVHVLVSLLVLVPVWRRSYRLRPVVLPVDATHGQQVGVPELDETSGPHVGLTGQVPPPTRW
jgi:hypothetical protein